MSGGIKVYDKAYQFALTIVKLCYALQTERKEYILSKQLIRSATSIGANLQEAIGGVSDKDFLHKLSISYKEARESKYWAQLLRDSSFIEIDVASELLKEIEEILKMLGASIRTMKARVGR